MERGKRRHQKHDYGRGEEDAAADRGGEGNKELRLNGVFENKRGEAEEGGQGSKHDRAKSSLRTLDDRGSHRNVLPELLVGEIDHHQGIVHHHAGEAENSDKRFRAHGYPQYPVTQDHADEPKRDDGHDDEWFGIGAQRNG